MEFGFLVRLRCLLVIDDVLVRCRERRFYHEFDIFDDQTRDQMSHSSMERPQSFQFSNNLEENNLTKTADKSSFDEFKGLKNDASKMSRKPTLYLTSLQKNNPEIPRLSNHNYQHVVIIQSQVLQKERSFSHILKVCFFYRLS